MKRGDIYLNAAERRKMSIIEGVIAGEKTAKEATTVPHRQGIFVEWGGPPDASFSKEGFQAGRI
jgi:hypothetical protein